LEPVEGAVETLEQWRLRGFEIAIVTGRPPETHEAWVAWLGEHRVPYDSFAVVNKYARFPTENSAAIGLDELASRKFCWAVEDSLPIAEFLADRMKLPVALMDRPWNQNDASDHERIARYSDWRSVAAAYCQVPLDSQ
jgi:uncharacterized HAD superfamily protein